MERLMTKRFIFAVLAAFAIITFLDYFVHGFALVDLYQRTSVIWRSPEAMHMGVMYLSQFIFACVFVYIFSLNYEGKGLAEGARYGSYIGLLFASIDLGAYAYLPVPFELTACWMLASFAKSLFAGLGVAAIYEKVTT